MLSRNKKKRSIRVVEYYFFAGVAGAAPVPNNLLQKPGPVKVFNTDRTSSPLASSSIYEIEIEPFVLPTSSAQPFHSSTPYPAARKSPKKQLRCPRTSENVWRRASIAGESRTEPFVLRMVTGPEKERGRKSWMEELEVCADSAKGVCCVSALI